MGERTCRVFLFRGSGSLVVIGFVPAPSLLPLTNSYTQQKNEQEVRSLHGLATATLKALGVAADGGGSSSERSGSPE